MAGGPATLLLVVATVALAMVLALAATVTTPIYCHQIPRQDATVSRPIGRKRVTRSGYVPTVTTVGPTACAGIAPAVTQLFGLAIRTPTSVTGVVVSLAASSTAPPIEGRNAHGARGGGPGEDAEGRTGVEHAVRDAAREADS